MTFIADDSQEAQPGVRAKPPQHTAEYLATTYKCAERRDHRVRIHRAKWPPRTGGSVQTGERHYLSGLCERCGANLIVYDPPDASVTVVLYGDPSDAHGRVQDEQGVVVDEAGVPAAGGVVDEPVVKRK